MGGRKEGEKKRRRPLRLKTLAGGCLPVRACVGRAYCQQARGVWFWPCLRDLKSSNHHRHRGFCPCPCFNFEPLQAALCGKPDAQHHNNKDTQPSLPTDRSLQDVVAWVAPCSLSKSTRQPRRRKQFAALYGHAHLPQASTTRRPAPRKTRHPLMHQPHTLLHHTNTGIGRSPGSSEAPVIATRPQDPNTTRQQQWHDSTSHSTSPLLIHAHA
jgi:hypothetical protein